MALLALQTVHSAIFLVAVIATVWIWVCVVRGRRRRSTYLAVIYLAAIGAGLVLHQGVCPLQDVAQWIVGTEAYVQDMLTPEAFNDQVVPVLAPPAVLGIVALIVLDSTRRFRQSS